MDEERGGPHSAGRPFSLAQTVALCFAVALGTLLRAVPISERPVSLDEALTWRTAARPWTEFLSWSHHPDHPPLSFALVRLTMDLAGTDAEWALRLPSVLAGALAIPAAAAAGAAFSPAAGVALAALVAVDPVLVEQGRVARMYPLLFLFLLLTLASATRLAGEHERRSRAWIGLGLALGAAIWTHALGVAAWLAALACLPLARPSKARARLGGSLLLAAALAIPGVIAFLRGDLGGRGRPGGIADVAGEWEFVAGGALGLFGLGIAGWLLVPAGILGLAVLARRSPFPALLLGGIAALTVIAVLAAAPARPFGVERYLIPVHLAVLAGVSVLAVSPRGPVWRMGTLCCTAIIILAFSWRALPRDAPSAHLVGALARALAVEIAPETPVVFRPAYLRHVGAYYGIRPAVEEPERGTVWIVTQDQRFLRLGTEGALPGEVRRRLPRVAAARGAAVDLEALERRLKSEHALGIRLRDGEVHVLSPGVAGDARF
jgi:4-amino-4-deoxy-L-arabinose transferase-like glycosyltransferase